MDNPITLLSLFDLSSRKIVSVVLVESKTITKAWVAKDATVGPTRSIQVTINPRDIDKSEILGLAIELECVNDFVEVNPKILRFSSLENLFRALNGEDQYDESDEQDYPDEFPFDEPE